MLGKNQKGSVLAEYAIIIPLILFLTFGCFQLAFLFVADSVMEYAAFCAARSYIVQITDTSEEPKVVSENSALSALKAAQMVTSLISFFNEKNEGLSIPGQGELSYSSYSVNHTHLEIYSDGEFMGTTSDIDNLKTVQDPNEIKIVVNFDYRPMFPALTLPTLSIAESVIEINSEGFLLLKKSCKMVTN